MKCLITAINNTCSKHDSYMYRLSQLRHMHAPKQQRAVTSER